MPRVPPLKREELPELEPLFRVVEQLMGFLPNSLLTMARRPELLKAFAGLAGLVNGPGALPPATKQLVAFVSSRAAGCSEVCLHPFRSERPTLCLWPRRSCWPRTAI